MGNCGSKEDAVANGSLPSTRRQSAPKNGQIASSAKYEASHNAEKPGIDQNESAKQEQVATVPHGKSVSNNQKAKKEVKMLLLGSGESGKSTILKQIKIIHQNGYTERELYDYKPFVFKNLSDCAKSIVKALRDFGLADKLAELNADDLEQIYSTEISMERELPFDQSLGAKIKELINDPVVVKLIEEHRNEFYLLDSASYFFDSIDRITSPKYVCSVTDVLRTRKQTSGIYDIKFQMEDINIHLYDVGGQRSERKKWIHCFDNVAVIMFCVSLSEYDQVLLESEGQNRLEESLNLFDSVVNSMWFRRTSVVLFLNKIDVLVEKLPHSPLEAHFPDYAGGNDVNKAVKYILWRFKQLNRMNLNIMPYVTQATDTSNIKLAFAVVKETIIHNALMDSGILQV
ncbi:unnamed protein product [Kuraishia capsulata CBS 1993]|uniref:Guanine nucleotide-binding protein alpha-2 subunit n=1 Tax=Kuraishia capsulata CBS 1993 TaxID=1382522 RepID=W6MX30_9ASCO|nr:uncharacterized protein KUCA_T00004156001 [Kuraishia capsulata CBS 1993]CDK28175.1 unnamed protein product [Kuraishia capsulata CBS 1993]